MKPATSPVQVICHDQSTAISGHLRRVDDRGCELISNVRTAGPVFAKKSRVLLNLLDEQSGRSMNVLARLTGVIRDQGAWVYRVQWRSLPELLEGTTDEGTADGDRDAA